MRQIGEELNFSVCTVTHGDRRELLEVNVESVAALYNKDDFTFEHVVLDNGSTDETPAYLMEAQEHHSHLRAVRIREHIPLGAARNKVFEVATTDPQGRQRQDVEYVVPLDADDYMLSRGLLALSKIAHDYNAAVANSIRMEYVEERRQDALWVPITLPEVVFGAPQIVDSLGRPGSHKMHDFDTFTWSEDVDEFMYNLYEENRLTVGCVAIAPEAVRRAGGWDPNPDLVVEDWGFWLNLFATVEDYAYDESRYISAYRQHPDQTSASTGIEEAWRQDGFYLRRQLLARHIGTG